MLAYFKKHWKGLIISIIVVEVVGIMSGFLAENASEIYGKLTLPPLSPPDWLFGVVWPILYALMGVAAYQVYEQGFGRIKDSALALFNVQLIFNFLWPVIFFQLQLYWLTVLVIIILDILVIITIQYFNRVNMLAGRLLYPYLIWILFATYLNIGIAFLN